MLKYPEVYTNLRFIPIPTITLEIQAEVVIKTYNDKETGYGLYLTSASDSVRKSLCLPEWIQHHTNHNTLLYYLKCQTFPLARSLNFAYVCQILLGSLIILEIISVGFKYSITNFHLKAWHIQ